MSVSTSEFVGFKKHETYYIKGGDVYFLVEECMFCVHRYFFERESSKFQQMFSGMTSPGKEPEGSSPDTAFRLSDITAEDFAHFLWIFYNPRPSAYDAPTHVWIAILRTAYKWSFPEIKALAIKELERKTMNFADPIVLYENYKDDPSVMALLYAKLCSHDEPLTMEQSVCLGIETAVRIFQARERLRSSSLNALKSPLPDDVDLADVIQVIDEIWEGDMKHSLSGRDGAQICSTAATQRYSEEQEKERARVAGGEPMTAKGRAEVVTKPEKGKVIEKSPCVPCGPTLAMPGPSVPAPRKTATVKVPKIPAQLPTQSAWSRDLPQTASSSQSQYPAPQNTPVHVTHSSQNQNSTSLEFNPGSSFGKGGSSSSGTFSVGDISNFASSIGGSELSSDDRFNMSNNTCAVPANDAMPMSFRVPTGAGSQHGCVIGHGSSAALAESMLEPVAPLLQSANRWDRRLFIFSDPDSPDVVDRKVKGLLNKLTMEKFDSISDQIIAWANKSEKEKDGRTLIQVIRLVFESAIDQATWSEMYACLCRKMMEQISSRVQDDGIKNAEGKPIAGGQLFRKYLLNRCQDDFERGWVAKEVTTAAAASKAIEDQAAKAAAEKKGDEEEEIALYSEEYYAAQKAKRQGLGLIKFIGELFKLQMLTERIMHECVKKLLGSVENPEEEGIESLCKLLTTVGQLLDTSKARAHMDVYFSRMKELTKSLNVSSRMQFMLQDILELRERKWVSRNAVAAPTTLAQIHETAAKEKAAQEKESYQRQMSMSRGGSRRGGDRGDFPQVGPDGWAVAGGNSAPRPPSKAGDLSKFGQISNKGAPLTFGPQSSIYAGKKDKRESVQRTNSSSQNMFSMLNNDSTAEATPKEMLQRKRLVLQPRSKPVEGQENAPTTAESEGSSDEEVTVEPEPIEMSDKDAKKKIEEDIKEFGAVRNLDEAEVYFTQLPAKHHTLLVDKLISFAVESKEADAQLVSDLFSRASTKNLCTIADLESGFGGVLEFLEDIAIDAPMAFKLMAIMMKGPAFDDEQRTRLASKTDSGKLLGLLS